MNHQDAQAATLDALRRWSATDRATLVASAWQAGNRNVSELARAARVGRDAIYTDLRAKNIAPSTSREEPPTMPTATAEFVELPVPGWRHPHLLAVKEKKFGDNITEYQITTKPFTGLEPEPEVPQEWRGTHPSDGAGDDNWRRGSRRWTETKLVRKVWAKARFTHQIGELLKPGRYSHRTAAEVWQTYTEARDALQAAYAALNTTPDNAWRMALLRILDAKTPAEQAAKEWDHRAAEFAELDEWLHQKVGDHDHPFNAVLDAAKTHGVDIAEWLIEAYSEYTNRYTTPPAAAEIKSMISAGDERIRQVRNLTDKH